MDATNVRPEGNEEPKSQSQAPKKKGSIQKRSTGQVQVKGSSPENFIAFALQAGRSMEEIQQLIKFRNDELMRVAKLEFKEAKASFLKNCPAIVKNREAPLETTKEGKRWGGYKYTDLDHLINTVKEAEGNAGLSHDWEDGRNDKGEIVVTCILSHVGGHEKRTTMAWAMDKSGGKNDIQAMKSTISYLRRATLESVLGLSQGGDDNDGKDAPGQTTFTDLPSVTEEGYKILLKSIRTGTMTLAQAMKTYALSEEQIESLRLVEPPANANP